MYDKSDPRASLLSEAVSKRSYDAFRSAEYARFYELEPQVVHPQHRTWLTRGQNAVIAYSIVERGGCIIRKQQMDEWAILMPDRSTSATLIAEDDGARQTKEIAGPSITFVPPGDSEITFPDGGRLVRVFTTRSTDIAALCPNALNYADVHPVVPPYKSWPIPRDGFRVRSYQERSSLTTKHKVLCFVAMCTATNQIEMLKTWLVAAVNAGCSRTEVQEAILTMAIYGGWPPARKALEAVAAFWPGDQRLLDAQSS